MPVKHVLRNTPTKRPTAFIQQYTPAPIHRNVRSHGAVQLESMADWGIIVLINITPCGSLNNYLNESSSLQNVVYITLSFPKKTHYWERKSPHVSIVLMKYDSTLSPHNIILKLNRWSLPVPLIHVKFTQHTFWFVSTYRCSLRKKFKQILLNETTRHYLTYIYRLINKYDTFLKYASFVVLLKKTLQYIWMT